MSYKPFGFASAEEHSAYCESKEAEEFEEYMEEIARERYDVLDAQDTFENRCCVRVFKHCPCGVCDPGYEHATDCEFKARLAAAYAALPS